MLVAFEDVSAAAAFGVTTSNSGRYCHVDDDILYFVALYVVLQVDFLPPRPNDVFVLLCCVNFTSHIRRDEILHEKGYCYRTCIIEYGSFEKRMAKCSRS